MEKATLKPLLAFQHIIRKKKQRNFHEKATPNPLLIFSKNHLQKAAKKLP